MEIVGALYGSGGRTKGTEEGASTLFEVSKLCMNNTNRYILLGPDSCDINLVTPFMLDLKACVREHMNDSEFILILGGDHSISMASICAIIENTKYNTGVIYVDAHADMNTFKTSPSGNIHGMPLAVCLGIENSFKGISKVPLNKQNLLLLGTRSIDEGEQLLINDLNIQNYSTDYLLEHDEQDIDTVIHDFITKNEINNLHISFDIDVIDPVYAPATGVPELNGITESKALAILEKTFNTGLVRSMDIVEFNPSLDIENQTQKICNNIIKCVAKNIENYVN